METLIREDPASPADFTLSVHHALAGLLSIARENEEGYTAIAAGRDSLACGLVEAAALVVEGAKTPVQLLYYDEPLPAPFDSFSSPGEETVALTLTLNGRSGGLPLKLGINPASGGPASLHPGLDLIDFLSGSARSTVVKGDRHLYSLEKCDGIG